VKGEANKMKAVTWLLALGLISSVSAAAQGQVVQQTTSGEFIALLALGVIALALGIWLWLRDWPRGVVVHSFEAPAQRRAAAESALEAEKRNPHPVETVAKERPATGSVFQQQQEVVVTDISMPFGSMVRFMVKWAIASIPALIILVFLGAAVWGVIVGLLGPKR
jgi:FtsH-binding integral membrane protein